MHNWNSPQKSKWGNEATKTILHNFSCNGRTQILPDHHQLFGAWPGQFDDSTPNNSKLPFSLRKAKHLNSPAVVHVIADGVNILWIHEHLKYWLFHVSLFTCISWSLVLNRHCFLCSKVKKHPQMIITKTRIVRVHADDTHVSTTAY